MSASDKSPSLEADESAEAAMIGELHDSIVKKDAECECIALEMHALEALQTPTAKALKLGVFTDLAWRRAFFAMRAAKRLGVKKP